MAKDILIFVNAEFRISYSNYYFFMEKFDLNSLKWQIVDKLSGGGFCEMWRKKIDNVS